MNYENSNRIRMEDLKYYDRIEKYVEGQLQPEERILFERELKVNGELKNEYDAFVLSKEVADVLGYRILSTNDEEKAIKKEFFIAPKSVRKPIRVWRAIAASVVLVCTVTWMLVGSSYTNSALVEANRIEVNVSGLRGASSQTVLGEIVTKFENKEYNVVMDLTGAVVQDDADYLQTQYIRGHTALETGDFNSAIAAFVIAQESADPTINQNAKWHLMLSYLQAGNELKATELLEYFIGNTNSDFHNQAQELQSKMNSFWFQLF